jgi:t-SNARE complex subunit (syntaxin)
MKPIAPNTKPELKKIHKAIAELTTIVSEIKNELSIVNKKVDDTNQLSLDLPNVTTTADYHEEER